MKYCAGITIGPIFDTISDATVPAALWFASYLFSDVTRRICVEITDKFPQAEIISPYYYKTQQPEPDGVGKYHDRIIFIVDGEKSDIICALKDAIRNVKAATADAFPDFYSKESCLSFFNDYLQIHFVVLPKSEDSVNSVLVLSPYLDELELMKTFPVNDLENPFTRLFATDDTRGRFEPSRNESIKRTKLFSDKYSYLLNKDNNIRSISEIAGYSGNNDLKYSDYFAAVSADGDGMGKFLEKLDDAKVTDFSRACLKYDTKAAKLVYEFGGMSIYAGGDDLVFLAPVIGESGRSVIELCDSISKLFEETIKDTFKDNESSLALPTLSFGVSIQFQKFPLYEAMELSRNMLYKAKSVGEKNNTVLNLRKHSGQSLTLCIHNPDMKYFDSLASVSGATGQRVNSCLYTLGNFRALATQLFKNAGTQLKENVPAERVEELFLSAWSNLFDNPDQKGANGYFSEIGKRAFESLVNKKAEINSISDEERRSEIDALTDVLRWSKFLCEKAGEKD